MDVPVQTHQLDKQYQMYHNIIHSSILVTKESSNKHNDQNIIQFMGKEPALKMKKKSYNHRLSVVFLLHMPLLFLKISNLLLLCSPYIWLESQCSNITFLSLNHGVWARFYRPWEDRNGWENGGWGGWGGREIILGGISIPSGPQE